MTQYHIEGDPPIEVILRRSARAKRMTLRVSRMDGRVTLSIPPYVSEKEAMGFARSRAAWLRRSLDDVPDQIRVTDGARLLLEGREIFLKLLPGPKSPPVLIGNELRLSSSRPAASVAGYFKTLARDRLVAASDRYAALLGRDYSAITLRDTRSRWGSCTVEGRLMYSWRLIMAPPDVLEYVAAHEVAHLVHMDHSPEFWAQVESLCPAYRAPRKWLRENGAQLHGYLFKD